MLRALRLQITMDRGGVGVEERKAASRRSRPSAARTWEREERPATPRQQEALTWARGRVLRVERLKARLAVLTGHVDRAATGVAVVTGGRVATPQWSSVKSLLLGQGLPRVRACPSGSQRSRRGCALISFPGWGMTSPVATLTTTGFPRWVSRWCSRSRSRSTVAGCMAASGIPGRTGLRPAHHSGPDPVEGAPAGPRVVDPPALGPSASWTAGRRAGRLDG